MVRIRGALDFTSDWAVAAFAVWTAIAYLGMLTGAAATLLVTVWLATVPLVGVALAAARRRHRPPPDDVAAAPHDASLSHAGGLPAVVVASALLSALLLGLGRRVAWPVAWAPAAVAVALTVMRRRRDEGAASDLVPDTRRSLPDLLVAVVCVLFAAMALLLDNTDGDDAFYVNRATATADLNRIPVRDVLFTDEGVPPISGAGLPVDAVHALQGAFARLVGVHAATMAYLVTTPVAAFLATWALWRLLRAWAPRHVLTAFALSCVYWLWSAELHLNPGSFFLARIWQGKVIFVAWLVPTTYVLLTRWLRRRDPATAVLLLAAGLAAIGLTSSATFVAPLVFVTAGLVLSRRREWRSLPVVIVAGAVPFCIGVAVTRHFPVVPGFAGALHGNHWFFASVVGVGVVAAIGAAAVLLAPWLARSGPAADLTTAIAVVATVLLAPGALSVLSDVSGLTDTLRRTLWIVPLPVLVGLLAVPQLRRLPALALPLALAGLLIAFGQPLWQSPLGDTYWTSRPTWKTSTASRDQARAILERYHDRGAILADEPLMLAIAIQTAHPKAVNPRTYYARLLPEPRQRVRRRLLLTHFAETGDPGRPDAVIRALADLRVGLICVDAHLAPRVRSIGLDALFHPSFSVAGLQCLRRGAVRHRDAAR